MNRVTQRGTGVFGNGMHDFILRDMELGERVAMAQDDEDCGYGALFDLSYEQYLAEEYARTVARPMTPEEIQASREAAKAAGIERKVIKL